MAVGRSILIAADVSVVCAFLQWWAGHCFGPRFMAGTVPWFVLLGALALRANLKWRGERTANSLASWRAQSAFGIALLVLSVFINTNGAGCCQVKQGGLSSDFFRSEEFQETGYLVYRLHKAAYGDIYGAPVPLRLADFI